MVNIHFKHLNSTWWQAANIEIEANGIHNGEYQLMKHEFSTECSGKYSGKLVV